MPVAGFRASVPDAAHEIVILGAKEHNLQNIDVRIPSGVDGRRPAQLRIVVNDAGDGINDDHTDVVNAGFVVSGRK